MKFWLPTLHPGLLSPALFFLESPEGHIVLKYNLHALSKKDYVSGGPINLPKFLPISFFRRVYRFIGVSGHLAFQ